MIQRNTAQRSIVLSTISRFGHMELAQIIDYLKNTGSKVSVATVYRTVDALLESGLIQPITVNGRILYHVVRRNHHHFYCTECGKVEDVGLDEIENLRVEVPPMIRDNKAKEAQLVIYGVCKNCLDNHK